VTDRRTDRQTDGQTDGQTEFSSQYRVCITCSAVKRRCAHKKWSQDYGQSGLCQLNLRSTVLTQLRWC